jgi:hypothetical protein
MPVSLPSQLSEILTDGQGTTFAAPTLLSDGRYRSLILRDNDKGPVPEDASTFGDSASLVDDHIKSASQNEMNLRTCRKLFPKNTRGLGKRKQEGWLVKRVSDMEVVGRTLWDLERADSEFWRIDALSVGRREC